MDQGGTGCNAADFTQILLSTSVVAADDCGDGKIDLEFQWTVTRNGNGASRYDIGFWIPLDGSDPRAGGQCEKSAYLGAPVANSWSDDEAAADTCLDIGSTETGVYTQQATLDCVDNEAPYGVLDDPFVCLSWDNNIQANCNADGDVLPGTDAKCQCTSADTSSVTFPSCGNDILEDGEECDDGNREDGDSCSSTCTIPMVPTVGEWGRIVLAVAMLGIGAFALRRKLRTA